MHAQLELGNMKGKVTVWIWKANIKIALERASVSAGLEWFRYCPVVG